MPGQVFVTSGVAYDVHALTVFEGQTLLQIVNDVGYPAWLPGWLFDIVDRTLAQDWIVNLFESEPTLVMGPEFLAKDLASYIAMVELQTAQVEEFWQRLRRLRPAESAADE
jgi:hypothetical protein